MYFAILSFASVPFAAACLYLIQTVGCFSNQALEQTKLDALVLTLCHQEQNFLQSEIAPLNSQIRLIRNSMTVMTATCLAEANADPPLSWPIMVACHRRLQKLERIGTNLELSQDMGLQFWDQRRTQIYQIYQEKNKLETKFLKSKNNLPLKKGFERKALSSLEKASEILMANFGPKISWPQDLVANSEFENVSERQLIYRDAPTSSWARSESLCHIKEILAGMKFQVVRKKDEGLQKI